jgi:hypothetical protein
MEKKKYVKPSMEVHYLKQSQILCASPEAPGYPGGPFGYAPGDDEKKLA